MKNYVPFHIHSDFSNPTTIMDSATKVQQYVDRAKELGMKAFGFAEHGNVFEWTSKKQAINDAGMKYLHGVEAYVTETLEDKIRDNYHICLIAKNYEGVKEINTLMSHKYASNRNDGHFYYNPRITFDELINTSDNIIITTACLGNILNKGKERGRNELVLEFLRFLVNNKHRCFLEIQHHNVEDQIKYNKELYSISKQTGIPLIAGTDTHSIDEDYAKGRIILQKSKNVYFENEDGWDLTFKSYDELVESYEKQDALPMDVVLEAIENTNMMADMVEDFELDRSHKYPQLHDDPEKRFKQRIAESIKDKGVDITDEVVKERIQREYKGFKDTGTINYMLLEDDIKSWCRENNILYGYGRGSVGGSYLAYLLDIHMANSIEHNLIFERFINPERVSLAD